jgi:hypothetical protein
LQIILPTTKNRRTQEIEFLSYQTEHKINEMNTMIPILQNAYIRRELSKKMKTHLKKYTVGLQKKMKRMKNLALHLVA